MAYTPGSFNTKADYGFLSAMDLHKPQFDNELGKRFGNQYLSEFLMNIGYQKPVHGYEYFNFQENRIYPKLKATTGGANAGAVATFTLDASSQQAIDLGTSPFVGTVDRDITVARIGDIISIKPVSGTVNSSSMVLSRVQSVNVGAGTFTAIPLQAGDVTPAIGSATEIAIVGNAFGEGSAQPKSRSSKVTKYSNNLQIFKETFGIPGTARAVQTWTDFTNAETGEKGRFYHIKGEQDAYIRFLATRELSLLTNKKITNTTLADAEATNGEPLMTTEGLIPFIQSQGNTSSYSGLNGFDKNEMDNIVFTLDSQKGAKDNLFMCGIKLSVQIDDVLADSRQNGAITFGNYSFDSDAQVNYQFDKYKIGNYTFNKKTMDSLNDLQSLGAEGYGYPHEGMIIPMDNKIDGRNGESIQSLRIRYLADENGERQRESAVINMFAQTESGKDQVEVRYKDALGFEGIGGNRFVYIERA